MTKYDAMLDLLDDYQTLLSEREARAMWARKSLGRAKGSLASARDAEERLVCTQGLRVLFEQGAHHESQVTYYQALIADLEERIEKAEADA